MRPTPGHDADVAEFERVARLVRAGSTRPADPTARASCARYLADLAQQDDSDGRRPRPPLGLVVLAVAAWAAAAGAWTI